MTDPLPPFFPVEKDFKKMDALYSREVTKIFNKVLQEANKNRISVGGSVSVYKPKCLYNPHNCRAYFDFSKGNYNPQKTEVSAGCSFKVINSTEHSFTNFFSCTIRVRKNTIEIANLINPTWHVVEATTEAHNRIHEIVSIKVEECKKVLVEFIKLFGGSSNFILTNLVIKDNKIQGEDGIDKIPKYFHFQNRVGKKEYGEKEFEFKSPELASNYLENSAIRSIAPDISQEMKRLAEQISKAENYDSLKKASLSMIDKFTDYLTYQKVRLYGN